MNLKNIVGDEGLQLKKKKRKGKLYRTIDGVGEVEIDPLAHLKGADGFTPIKGEDYFTPEEQEAFKEEITPIKGKDYVDGVDGYNPEKGKDYFDGEKGEPGADGKSIKGDKGNPGYTPVKGKDYDDGKDGKPGKKGKDGITTVVTQEKDLPGKVIVEKIEELKGDERLDVEKLKNLEKVVQWARAGVSGGGIQEETDPIYEADKPDIALKENVLELDNTVAFTPDADYEPSTKKYVDDAVDDVVEKGTKAEILATTATLGNIAYATDTFEFYMADGTDWRKVPFTLETQAEAPDMGMEQGSSKLGYRPTYLTNKVLENITIGYSNKTTPDNGDLRITTGDYLQIYLGSKWNNIVFNLGFGLYDIGYTFYHDPVGFTERIEIMSGNSVTNFGLNGLPIVQQYVVSMGAYPSRTVLGGRTF